MRNLLIAALFDYFDYPGHLHPSEGDPDRINIPIAITGLWRYVIPADRPFLPQIDTTHYPYKIGSDKLDLLGQIVRGADQRQANSRAIVKRPNEARGFCLQRWLVERTFTWVSRNRRLAKDFEATIGSAEARPYPASVQLLARLARSGHHQ